MARSYGEAADELDDPNKIPLEYVTPDEVAGYMHDRFGDTMSDGFIEKVAPRIGQRRVDRANDVPIDSNSEGVYNPETDRWRDPETGEFL